MATRSNPVQVHYGLSRRTISYFCIAWGSHFRPTPLLTLDIFLPCFFFFLLLLFGNLFLTITFFQPTRIDALEFCSLVRWAIYSLSHGSYRDFLSSFSPTGFFFRQVLFWPPSDSSVICLLIVSFVLNRILRSCIIGCSITCHYCYWCSV